MNQGMKLLRCGACALALALLAGCLYPHTSPRSPEFTGRVLDAETHAPIEGAKIVLLRHPHTSCKSDATGHFRLKETHNCHLGIVPVAEGPSFPRGDYASAVNVWHVGYETKYLSCFDAHGGDVLLAPIKRGDNRGPL
jgi:hypothetical protein